MLITSFIDRIYAPGGLVFSHLFASQFETIGMTVTVYGLFGTSSKSAVPRGERSQYQRGHSPMCLSSGKKFAKLGWEHESDYIHDIVDSVHIYHLPINQPCYLRQVDVLIEFRRDTRQNWRLRGVFGFCSSDTEKVGIPSMSQDPKINLGSGYQTMDAFRPGPKFLIRKCCGTG